MARRHGPREVEVGLDDESVADRFCRVWVSTCELPCCMSRSLAAASRLQTGLPGGIHSLSACSQRRDSLRPLPIGAPAERLACSTRAPPDRVTAGSVEQWLPRRNGSPGSMTTLISSMGCYGFGLHQARAPRLRTDCRPASLVNWCGRVSVSRSSHSGGYRWEQRPARIPSSMPDGS
jgi:hypothetical protein